MEYNKEYEYLFLLKKILDFGEEREDRTGNGTISLFGERLEFNLENEFPLLTTKKVFLDKIILELLFFISGKTDTKILENQNVNIWKGNTSLDFIKKRGLTWDEGDMGPGYSFQWRHYGAEYQGCHLDYTNQGIDQLNNLIEGIKKNPYDRRHILCSWNVKDLDMMVLPPCHCLVQFYVSKLGYLDCQMYQRSADVFLGVPFNIASYSLLTYMIAKICNLKPRKFIHIFGDVHIYKNHIEQVKEQLSRIPYKLPILEIISNPKTIFDFKLEDFKIINYKHHSYIKADMAI